MTWNLFGRGDGATAECSPSRRVGRRRLLQAGALGAAGLTASRFHLPELLWAADGSGQPSPEDALRRIVDGNRRYVAGMQDRPNQTQERRIDVSRGQKPWAIVLGCIDSRVPPEIVFDQGLGDLFVVRVGGNVVDNIVIGSIEFGVQEFGIPLVVVLGHEKCGAVKATLDLLLSGGEAEGRIYYLTQALEKPVRNAIAVDASRPTVKDSGGHAEADILDAAVRANIDSVVRDLKRTEPILTEAVKRGALKIIGMRYDLSRGAAEVIA